MLPKIAAKRYALKVIIIVPFDVFSQHVKYRM